MAIVSVFTKMHKLFDDLFKNRSYFLTVVRVNKIESSEKSQTLKLNVSVNFGPTEHFVLYLLGGEATFTKYDFRNFRFCNFFYKIIFSLETS